MGHSTQKNILENFESCVEVSDITNMAQLLVDGLNFNVKFLKVLQN